MRTIVELKHSYGVASAKNQLTLCSRIDSRWAEVVGSEPDCSDFFSIIMVEQGCVCVGINYHMTLLTTGDLLIVTPRTMLDIQKIGPDFLAYHLAVDQSSFEGMLSMESAYRHLVMFYTSSPVPVLHSTDKAQEVMVSFMDQLDHLMQCAVTNVYIVKMMLLVEQALMLQIVNILPEHFAQSSRRDLQTVHRPAHGPLPQGEQLLLLQRPAAYLQQLHGTHPQADRRAWGQGFYFCTLEEGR